MASIKSVQNKTIKKVNPNSPTIEAKKEKSVFIKEDPNEKDIVGIKKVLLNKSNIKNKEGNNKKLKFSFFNFENKDIDIKNKVEK